MNPVSLTMTPSTPQRDGALSRAYDASGADILSFALAELRAGRKVALATLVYVDGSSPRGAGTQMAVSQNGGYAGSISSGCLEKAIRDEALAALARGAGQVLRYGKGSKFLDITLPCGSGVDILYTVDLSADVLQSALASLGARRPCALDFGPGGVEVSARRHGGWSGEKFTRAYAPRLKLVAAGKGVELAALCRIALASGYDVVAVSPEPESLADCAGADAIMLTSPSALPPIALDPWSAFIFVFHEREWELALAPTILSQPAFFIGAVGSRNTHAARIEACRELGLGEAALARFKGPVGLLPATRDPATLAVSVLAEVVSAWPH